jgi:hypothetical protein
LHEFNVTAPAEAIDADFKKLRRFNFIALVFIGKIKSTKKA